MSVRGWISRNLWKRARYRATEEVLQEIKNLNPEATPNPYLLPTLQQALEEVPYYRQFSQRKLSAEAFKQFPLLTRQHLQNQFADLQNDQISRNGWREHGTSGSMGTPVAFIHDAIQHHWMRATEMWYYQNMVGMDLTDTPRVIIWSSSEILWGNKIDLPNRINLYLSQADRLGATLFTPAEFSETVRVINRRRPKLIQGYARCLFEIARYIQANNLRVHAPDVIVTTAENLLPEMRALIEEIFRAPVRDLYGTREVGFVAGQCSHGRMHRLTFNVHSEIVDELGNPVARGETGEVVVTSLHNRAMPLIRYIVGDMAVEPHQTNCPCGSKLSTFGDFGGRMGDYFPTAKGNMVYGFHFFQILRDEKWMQSFLIVQTEIDAIEVRYVPATSTPAGPTQRAEQRIRQVMGEECRVVWKPVDQLPPTQAGKRHYAISLPSYQAQQKRAGTS